MTRTALLAAAAVMLAACQPRDAAPPAAETPQELPLIQAPTQPAEPTEPTTPTPPQQATDNWRDYALPADVTRLERLDAAWDRALRRAWEEGHGADITKLGALMKPHPDLAPNPHPGPGDYRCRTYKVGGTLGFIAYANFRCRVELSPGGDLTLTKLTGSQRPHGSFYPYEDDRLVYLGGQAWGSQEEGASDYGDIPERDQIGVLERLGDNRWRLVLPWPRVESDLDIIELTR